MAILSFLLMFASLVLLIIGFFSAKNSLFWYKKERTKKFSALVYSIAFILFFILTGIFANKENHKKSNGESAQQTEQDTPASKGTKVGEVLKTRYFDIVVNRVLLKDRVNTGNEFADLRPEQGNMYLIINASFKNTDNESRMLMDGSVWINYNGKDYEYDKAEIIMLAGWGLLLDQINPLTTKTTNLVYKIPTEIKGPAFWQPGRATSDERIYLGTLR